MTGTLLKSDFTSKLTMMVSLWASQFSRICTKCAAYFTKELVSPASGEITFVNMRASSYVGELIVLTIGLSGTSCLCTLGTP